MGYNKYYDKLSEIYVISEELKQKYEKANYEISSLKSNTGHEGEYVSLTISLL